MFVSVDLPIPGEPPSSTSEPGTRPAAEHAVELADAGRQARDGCSADVAQAAREPGAQPRPGRRSAHARPRRARGGLGEHLLDERVPRPAGRALAVPLGRLGAAVGADVDGLAGHPARLRAGGDTSRTAAGE